MPSVGRDWNCSIRAIIGPLNECVVGRQGPLRGLYTVITVGLKFFIPRGDMGWSESSDEVSG